jgi:CRP-like cAMP-binding protein
VSTARTVAPLGTNSLLARLPARSAARLERHFDKVSLELKEVLYEAGRAIRYVYFPLSGVISLIVPMQDGNAVEVGTVGNEGMAGTPLFLGADRSPTRVLCQIPGDALRMRGSFFVRELQQNRPLARTVGRYTQALLNVISQSAACNHLHSVEQRMARWLLMTHDRVDSDEFYLTQEFLAQMLGVRRASVTVVAGLLQRAGLIAYQRGHIRILDRRQLELASCECYAVVKREMERLAG